MNTTWLLIGGLLDGEIRTINDNFVKEGRLISFVETPAEGGLVSVHYKMIVRGAVTDRISGGVLMHESLNPVQAYKMLILHYSTKLPTQKAAELTVDGSCDFCMFSWKNMPNPDGCADHCYRCEQQTPNCQYYRKAGRFVPFVPVAQQADAVQPAPESPA
jgi:hypothetical protein